MTLQNTPLDTHYYKFPLKSGQEQFCSTFKIYQTDKP